MQSPNRQFTVFGLWLGGLFAIVGLSGWRIVALGNGNTFFFDEWNFLLDRSVPNVHTWLTPHNGHLSIVPVMIYQVFLRLFGAGTYLPYRGAAMVLHCGIACVVALIVRRRAGYVAALAACAVVAFMGTGWQNWLWGFQIGMEISVLAGLLAIHLLTADQSRNRGLLVAALLTLSVASSGVGVSVLVGATLLAWNRRNRQVVRASLILVCFYGAWTIFYGDSQVSADNLRLAPSYVARSAAVVIAGIGAWDFAIGGVVAGGIAIVFLQRIPKLWREMPEVPALAVVLVMGWGLSALTRAQFNEPGASRYVHVGVSFAVPVVVLIIWGLRPHRRTAVYLVLLSTLAVWGSWDVADAAGREFRDRSMIVRAELTAMMQVTDPIRDDYQPDPSRAPQVSYARFEKFAEQFDTPLMSPHEIRGLPQFVRKEMDRVYLESTGVKLADGPQPAEWRCEVLSPNSNLRIDAGGKIWVSAAHSVEVRRMAKETVSLVPSTPGAPSILRFGRDENARPWIVRFVAAADVKVCRPAT